MRTAKHLALQVARRFTRRSPHVNRSRLASCHRRGERRIDCLAIARGETGGSRTTCRLRIAVRAVKRHPRAHLSSRNCRSRSLRVLSERRAAQAIRARGATLAGKPVALGMLERRARVSFFGTAEWTRQSAAPPHAPEECFALMEARLTPSDEVHVKEIEAGCSPYGGG
ncbi:MAG: hypothetical protein ACM3JL_00710 [Nitrososphaerota archaeon]